MTNGSAAIREGQVTHGELLVTELAANIASNENNIRHESTQACLAPSKDSGKERAGILTVLDEDTNMGRVRRITHQNFHILYTGGLEPNQMRNHTPCQGHHGEVPELLANGCRLDLRRSGSREPHWSYQL
jgi:hypothetical protein